ncbi:MAG: zeta toxin family protein, partial [Rhodocyclaceae bacterium]|nr:zeta toxin family protein [Rhodocyclaceae bacterium]
RALAQPVREGRDALVVFTAGGSGSGKSSAIGRALSEGTAVADITLDGTFSKLTKARNRVQAALDSGRKVAIRYVYCAPENAAKLAIGRAIRHGRPVPVSVMAETHSQALQTVRAIAEDFKGDERVMVIAIDNNGNKVDDAYVTDLEEIPEVNYDDAKHKFEHFVDATWQRQQQAAADEHTGTASPSGVQADNGEAAPGAEADAARASVVESTGRLGDATIPGSPQSGRARGDRDAVTGTLTPELYRAFMRHEPPAPEEEPAVKFSFAGSDENELLASFRETERIYGGREAWQRAWDAGRTELDYEQWITARTSEFRAGFGDWEIATAKGLREAQTFAQAKEAVIAFKGKTLENQTTGMEAVASGNNLRKMLNESAVKKSVSPQIQAYVVANLDRFYERAIYGWSKPDRNADPNINAIHRIFVPVLAPDGRALLAKLTVKEMANANDANPLYTVEAVEFNEESPAAIWVAASLKADGLKLTSIRSAGDVLSLAQRVENFNAEDITDAALNPATGEPLAEAIDGFRDRHQWNDTRLKVSAEDMEETMNTTEESSEYAKLLASFRETERAYGGREAWQRACDDGLTELNSELDYETWIVARTPEFKEYFGDWETARGSNWEAERGELDRKVNNALDIAYGAISHRTGEPYGEIIDDYIELVQHAEEMGVTLEQLRAEYDAVAARYKDTPQWMKAPNGEPTKLTERQWVLVRTPRFKAFFGNWEMQRDKELPVIEVSDRMFNGDRKAAQKWLTDKANNIVGTHGNDETGMQIAVSSGVLQKKSTSGTAQTKSKKAGTDETQQRRGVDHYEVLRQLPSLLKHASLAAAEA